MSARRIRDCWYVDFRFERKRYRSKSPVDSKRGAEAYEARLRVKLAQGDAVGGDDRAANERFSEFSTRWVERYARTENKNSEYKAKLGILRNHLVPALGDLWLEAITTERVLQYKNRKRTEGLAPKTVNNHLIVLKKCLSTAVEWGALSDAPTIKLEKTVEPAFDYLSEEEASRLCSAEADAMRHSMVLLALKTGLRRGELLGLQWEDVDLEHRLITVRRALVEGVVSTPKSHRIRHVPLAQSVVSALAARQRQSDHVFHRLDGAPLSSGQASRLLRRACRQAGLREVGWHVLRHTFASHLAIKGRSIYHIKELLGHASVEMTQRYGHLSPSALDETVAVLDEVQDGHHVGTDSFPVGRVAGRVRRIQANVGGLMG